MKIVHLTSAHSATDVRIFHKECKSIAKSRYQVKIIAQAEKTETIDGIEIIAICYQLSRIKRFLNVPRRIYKLALTQNADIYHFHDPDLLIVGYLLSKKGKCVIYDVHEDLPLDLLTKSWIPYFLRRPLAYFVNIIEKWISKRLSAVITATPEIQSKFINHSQKLFTIKNYAKVSDYTSVDCTLVAKRNYPYICYVGLLAENRGILETMKAAYRANIKLLLVGNFATPLFKEKCMISSEWSNVEYLGYQPFEKIEAFIRGALIGMVVVHPLKQFMNGLPTKLFEYMSAEIPVIASNFSLFQSIVVDNQCGICVDPYNVDEIVESIELLKRDPERVHQMGRNGRRAVISKYNWENEAKKLMKLYLNVV